MLFRCFLVTESVRGTHFEGLGRSKSESLGPAINFFVVLMRSGMRHKTDDSKEGRGMARVGLQSWIVLDHFKRSTAPV